jgi:hypothetical protein
VIQYYFDYNDSERQTLEDVVTSLLKQLVYQIDTIPPDLEEAYDLHLHRGIRARPTVNRFSDLLINCSKQFFTTVFLLIDAFDECLEARRPELLVHLQRFYEAGLRLFLTTRSHLLHQLEKKLQCAAKLEIYAQENDVQKYLTESLQEKVGYLDDKLQHKIVERISMGVDGKYVPSTAVII